MTGEALETAILEAGPENVAAFIAEPIGGSSTGASVPSPGYYARIREICDRHGVLFIADEVLTGVGRTGAFLALEHFKDATGKPIVPDIITLGKGLNGGYAPLSAMLARGTLVDYNAVCDALETGHLWGAGFDVFPEEPISPESRLLRTPHIVMTPHIAGASKQTAEKAARIAAGEVRHFLHGEPLEHCLNPEAAAGKPGR